MSINDPYIPIGQPDPERPTLRDRMAMAALTGFCANPSVFAGNAMSGWSLVNCSEDDLLGYCYLIADKGLAAR